MPEGLGSYEDVSVQCGEGSFRLRHGVITTSEGLRAGG